MSISTQAETRSKKISGKKESTRFYHILQRFPYFSWDYVEASSSVIDSLTESHKKYLKSCTIIKLVRTVLVAVVMLLCLTFAHCILQRTAELETFSQLHADLLADVLCAFSDWT